MGRTPFRAMVNLLKSIWLLVSTLHTPGLRPLHGFRGQQQAPKSIVVIGGGSAGLGVLKALQSLPTGIRSGWNITLYEEREDVAGIWCVAMARLPSREY